MNFFASLILALFAATASAEDLMAVCYSFTSHDACSASADKSVSASHENRRMLVKQGSPHPTKRRLLECGQFCEGWNTFCAEYLCDSDTLGMTCDDVIAKAKVHMEEYATEIGTDECKKQMTGEGLQCMCVDQDGV